MEASWRLLCFESERLVIIGNNLLKVDGHSLVVGITIIITFCVYTLQTFLACGGVFFLPSIPKTLWAKKCHKFFVPLLPFLYWYKCRKNAPWKSRSSVDEHTWPNNFVIFLIQKKYYMKWKWLDGVILQWINDGPICDFFFWLEGPIIWVQLQAFLRFYCKLWFWRIMSHVSGV